MDDIESTDEPFGEATLQAMCERAEALYDVEEDHVVSWSERITQRYFEMVAHLTQVNLYDYDRWKRGEKLERSSVASKIVRYYMYHCIVHLSIMLVLSYAQDAQIYKLRQHKFIDLYTKPSEAIEIASTRTTGVSNESLMLRQQLFNKYFRYNHLLEMIGGQGRDFPFMYEMLCLFVLWVSFTAIMRPYLMQRFVRPIYCSMLKMMDDKKREQKNYSRHTIAVLNKLAAASFVRSSNHMLCVAARINAYVDHRKLVQTLRRLALEGKLEPANRAQNSIPSIKTLRIRLLLWFLIPCVGLLSFGLFYIRMHRIVTDVGVVYNGPLDLYSLAQMWLISTASFVCMSGHFFLIGSELIDRISLIRSLEKQIQECLEAGNRLLEAHISGVQRKCFEEQLTLFLVNHRIGVKHISLSQWTMSLYCLLLSEMTVVPSILAILHAPLFRSEVVPIMFCALIVALYSVDTFLVAMCHTHAKAARLYRSTTRLAALVARVEMEQRRGRAGNSYLSVLLRANLSNPDLFVSQLSVNSFGSVYNYPRFMRAHFWSSMILCLALGSTSKFRQERLYDINQSFAYNFLSVF